MVISKMQLSKPDLQKNLGAKSPHVISRLELLVRQPRGDSSDWPLAHKGRTNRLMCKRDKQIFRRTNRLIVGRLERRFFHNYLAVETSKSTTVRHKFISNGQMTDDLFVLYFENGHWCATQLLASSTAQQDWLRSLWRPRTYLWHESRVRVPFSVVCSIEMTPKSKTIARGELSRPRN